LAKQDGGFGVTVQRGIVISLAIVGGTLFLCCVGGIGGFIYYINSLEPPEETIIGTWQLDRSASNYNPLVQNLQNGIKLEFRKDHTYRMVVEGPAQKGTYAITGKTGQTLHLTIIPEGPVPQRSDLFIEVRDKNRLYVDHRTLSGFEVTRQ
jgi:hypothetical protein